jgi:hypothetical protein
MIAGPSFQIVLERFLFLLLQGENDGSKDAAGGATGRAERCGVHIYGVVPSPPARKKRKKRKKL